MNPNNKYICIGENFIEGIRCGDCGDIRTLGAWLEHLFPTTNRKLLFDYFEGDPDNVVTSYIFEHKGKRLERVKALS